MGGHRMIENVPNKSVSAFVSVERMQSFVFQWNSHLFFHGYDIWHASLSRRARITFANFSVLFMCCTLPKNKIPTSFMETTTWDRRLKEYLTTCYYTSIFIPSPCWSCAARIQSWMLIPYYSHQEQWTITNTRGRGCASSITTYLTHIYSNPAYDHSSACARTCIKSWLPLASSFRNNLSQQLKKSWPWYTDCLCSGRFPCPWSYHGCHFFRVLKWRFRCGLLDGERSATQRVQRR